ncbi:Tyrosine-protein kinase, catalytic domain [Sesbania bispinosa]|nr:Tyrosine-protein kinase, catalytic domain [Sesbania bispinosa]
MGYLSCNAEEFSYSELLAATNGFSSDTFLGKGSHGSVYKATLDGGSLIAAVKSTKRHHTAADNEIEILSRVANPRRFVNLIGFSTDHAINNNNKLIVVEYMPNGFALRPPSLEPVSAARLDSTRPVRATNREGGSRTSFSGPAGDPPRHQILQRSHRRSLEREAWRFRSCTQGTRGGRSREMYSTGWNASPPSVLDWAVPLIRRGEVAGICDPRIGSPLDEAAIRKLAVLAARCVRSTAEKRPSMAEVVECVKAVRKRIHAPAIWNRMKRRVEARVGDRWLLIVTGVKNL